MSVFKTEDARARYLALYDRALANWPTPHEAIYAPTRFGRTHVIAGGPRDAPPLVLLPALAACAATWRPNVAQLNRRFRTYAIDVIGEPNRSEPTRPLKTEQDCAEWLSELFDRLNIRRASIVGSSLGGFRALNQALRAPERIDRLILISPAATFAPLTLEFFWRAGLGVGLGMGKQMSDWFGGGVPFDPANGDWAAMNAIAQQEGRLLSSIGARVFRDAELRSVRAPTLLLIGDREVIYRYRPQEVLRRARASMPGLQGEIVPGANHLAAVARPDDVDARILRFLQPGVTA